MKEGAKNLQSRVKLVETVVSCFYLYQSLTRIDSQKRIFDAEGAGKNVSDILQLLRQSVDTETFIKEMIDLLHLKGSEALQRQILKSLTRQLRFGQEALCVEALQKILKDCAALSISISKDKQIEQITSNDLAMLHIDTASSSSFQELLLRKLIENGKYIFTPNNFGEFGTILLDIFEAKITIENNMTYTLTNQLLAG